MHTEMSIEDIVNQTGVWLYQPPNQDQSYANHQQDFTFFSAFFLSIFFLTKGTNEEIIPSPI